VPKAKVKDMRDKIRKAGRLGVRLGGRVHEVQIRFGREDLFDKDGDVLVTFTVVDKSVTAKDTD
jgi:hypothetical protein